jgi:hypothetical protein
LAKAKDAELGRRTAAAEAVDASQAKVKAELDAAVAKVEQQGRDNSVAQQEAVHKMEEAKVRNFIIST